MRSCPRHLHIRTLRGGTGWGEYKWYHCIYETWFMTTLLIIWLVSLIILAVVD